MVNQQKSQPGPDCLEIEKNKANGSYTCGDVVERVKADFFNKCYLCEEKAPTAVQVEHFRPHRGNSALKFDWNNLFYACAHCNGVKGARFDHILDCTQDSPRIVDQIDFDIRPFPKEVPLIKALSESTEVLNTVEFLKAIYSRHPCTARGRGQLMPKADH